MEIVVKKPYRMVGLLIEINKMNAKEIGRRAGRVFEFHLPDGWIFRSQEDQEDYGLDGEIELTTANDQATGFIFKAQIKGQQKVTFIDGGNFVSFSLSLARLQYYMSQLEIVVMLFVVDISNENVYWHSLQNDENLRARMLVAIEKKQETITVLLDSKNLVMRDDISTLMKAVENNMEWLRLSTINKINFHNTFSKSSDELVESWLEKSKEVSFYAYMEQFERLFLNNDHEKLLSEIEKVFSSVTEKKELRFYAGLYAEKVCEQELGHKTEKYFEASFDIFSKILWLVRHERFEKYYQLYIVLLFRSWLLKKQILVSYHHLISKKMTEGDKLVSWVVDESRFQVSLKTSINLVKTARLINNAINQNSPNIFLDIFPKLGFSITVFISQLRQEGLVDKVEILESWMDNCINLGFKICLALSREDIYIKFLSLFITVKIHSIDTVAYLDEARTKLEKITNTSLKKSMLDQINDIESKLKNTSAEYNLTPEEELEFYKRHAKQLGFNYDDPNDEIGQIVNQGLKDYNPERVIKDCESLLVFYSSAQGMPARMMGLPSAAMKIIHCLKYGYTAGGWALDSIYYGMEEFGDLGFKNEKCNGCGSCKPRSADWHWSSNWQTEIYKEHEALYKRLNSIF